MFDAGYLLVRLDTFGDARYDYYALARSDGFRNRWILATTLLLATLVVPILVVPTRLVGKTRRRLSQQTQERQADLLAFLQERLTGMRVGAPVDGFRHAV